MLLLLMEFMTLPKKYVMVGQSIVNEVTPQNGSNSLSPQINGI